MSDLSQLNVNGTDYDLKDAAAREAIGQKCTAVELTMAQYNALSEAQKADASKIYFITDYSGARDNSLYIVNGTVEISNIDKYENTPGAIVVDVQSDCVKVTSTSGNNGAYGAEIDVTNYDYCILELNYCTNVYSYFGIGTNFSYDYGGNQVAKAALSNKTSPYRWVVDISNYSGMYYCYISCGGNARFDIRRMFLTNDVYQQGDIS